MSFEESIEISGGGVHSSRQCGGLTGTSLRSVIYNLSDGEQWGRLDANFA